jgi:hypothetical protein
MTPVGSPGPVVVGVDDADLQPTIGLLVIDGLRRDGVDDLGLVAPSALHHACPVLDVPR